jgi:hypothetical protein
MLPPLPGGRSVIGDYWSLTGAARPKAAEATGQLTRGFPQLPSLRRCYLSAPVNFSQAAAGTLSVPPSRSVVSLTRITPSAEAVSTHSPPLSFE